MTAMNLKCLRLFDVAILEPLTLKNLTESVGDGEKIARKDIFFLEKENPFPVRLVS